MCRVKPPLGRCGVIAGNLFYPGVLLLLRYHFVVFLSSSRFYPICFRTHGFRLTMETIPGEPCVFSELPHRMTLQAHVSGQPVTVSLSGAGRPCPFVRD